MHTVLVIGIFAAMVLAPCVIASCSGWFPQRSTPENEGDQAAPKLAEAAAPVHHASSSPLDDPIATRTR